MVFRGSGVGSLGQRCVIHEIMVLQISHGLGHLLQIEPLGPIRVTGTFALGELFLNVDQELIFPLGLLGRFCLSLPRAVLPLTGNDRFQLCGGITLAQGIHADEAFLLSAPQ